MQIVIEIPDAEYDYIKDFKGTNSTITGRLYEAVYNGIPLPKGHGRLIDEREIKTCFMPLNRRDARGIRISAPTVIEADKESENEE